MTLGTLGKPDGLDLGRAASSDTDAVRAKLSALDLIGYAPTRLEDILITLDGDRRHGDRGGVARAEPREAGRRGSVTSAFLLGWVGSLVGRRRDGRGLVPREDPLAVDALLVTGRPLASRALAPKDPSARIR
ncbi:hypothetical protein ACIBL8_43990 [Streptomyces sp. NPDC050523]|uniref:hypothetical protein n=1 Tax=Streptomyces sp. NPDC050523 TaxID=3365622 RepID=UPI0037937B20